MNYSEIVSFNKQKKKALKNPPIKIKFISNINLSLLTEVMKYHIAIKTGRNVIISPGNFDNILQDVDDCGNYDFVIVFWDVVNIHNGYLRGHLAKSNIGEITRALKNELEFFFKKIPDQCSVFFNLFTSISINQYDLSENLLDELANNLNHFVRTLSGANTILINLEKIFSKISISSSISKKNFLINKSLYTYAFYQTYGEYVSQHISNIQGFRKKVLVLDCDNTLWAGILGEDGDIGIEFTNDSPKGSIFKEAQQIFKKIKSQGALLAICSKNNQNDVTNFFQQNQENLELSLEDFVTHKINWNDKPNNLKEIANELNLGLDSFVFIDDSDIEVDMMKAAIPEVTVFQVPKDLTEYTNLAHQVEVLFKTSTVTNEDLHRTRLYSENKARENAKSEFGNITEYLNSLNININYLINPKQNVSRLAQMTQKTNQFNFTTKRYSDMDLRNYIEDDATDVIATSVKDKFGDNGITGLAIIKYSENHAVIDTLLLSCRILGRNIENEFLRFIIEHVSSKNIVNIYGKYIRTPKNTQIENFYEKSGFQLLQATDIEKTYMTTVCNTALPITAHNIKTSIQIQ